MTNNISEFAQRLRSAIELFPGSVARPGQVPLDFPCSANEFSREDVFRHVALELFSLQFASNSAYRRYCLRRDVRPEAIADWRQIPAVPTAAFKELELSCIPAELRTRVFLSSGTSREARSRHFHHDESLALYRASLTACFAEQLPVAEVSESGALEFVILTPPPAITPDSSLVFMFEALRLGSNPKHARYYGAVRQDDGWDLDCLATFEALCDATAARRPVLLLGTAFSFVHLLDYLSARALPIKLPPGSFCLETGGYKGRSRELSRAELHGLITAQLDIPADHIVCEYGMAELSSQAYAFGSNPDYRQFRFPPWVRSHVLSPETGLEVGEGETGLLRIFDLANAFSVMAVQTEDLAIRRGVGFELVGRVAMSEARGCSLMAV